MEAGNARKQAIARLHAKHNLRTQAGVFALVSLLLVIIWAASGAGEFWPIFPIAAFAVALGVQAWNVYGQKPITEEQIQEEMQRGESPPADAS
jgi:CHASE2 domain-containing sensor protein